MAFEIVKVRSTFQPRILRRGVPRGGASGDEKSRAFRRCKLISDQFIHQSADALESPRLNEHYNKYRAKTEAGRGFRR